MSQSYVCKQGFLEALELLAESGNLDYEGLLAALAATYSEPEMENAPIKVQPWKSMQRQSIVAQIWRKPSITGKVDSPSPNDK